MKSISCKKSVRISPIVLFSAVLLVICSRLSSAQDQSAALAQFFEGKQVTVKMDMPASQKGVDVYPQRPQPLDTKSYSKRLRDFGTSLRNGETVMVTKIKVKDNNVEFQLGGGGYGVASDMTDTSVHFTPADKSDREKELENQLSSETDQDRRIMLQRELDDARRDRERRDRRAQERAQDDAYNRQQTVSENRSRGGSRFNIRFDRKSGDALTPEVIMSALSPYLDFGGAGAAAAGNGPRGIDSPRPDPNGPPPPPPPAGESDGMSSLRKGLTRDQVEAIYGKPVDMQDHVQDNLHVTTCIYINKDNKLSADFVNNVLVRYSVSSR